jgi:L-ascorbate metabolism protein UlaG (beta-lactamase superfamily)
MESPSLLPGEKARAEPAGPAACHAVSGKWRTWTRTPIIGPTSLLEAAMLAARTLFVLSAALAGLCPSPASAQAADRCFAVSQAPRAIQPASLRPASLEASEVRLTFVGHATWLIESAGGIRIATDYNDYIRPSVVPEIATMNRAHTTHYSMFPDPGIKHVLPGWNPEGGPAKHDLSLADVRVRNVATNIRDWAGGSVPHGNSIFIFEVAGMCIGHLGHLHHTLTPQQIAHIGQLDVVMVAVDGSYTMDVAGVVETLKTLRARLILPMHYFNAFTLNRFLDRIRNDFPVETASEPVIVVSQATLAGDPKVLVLPGN